MTKGSGKNLTRLIHTTQGQCNTFSASAEILCVRSLTLKDSEIPTTIRQKQLLYYSNHLILDNIVDDEHGSGLRHIFNIWNNSLESKLNIRACPSFNDSILAWLQPSEFTIEFPKPAARSCQGSQYTAPDRFYVSMRICNAKIVRHGERPETCEGG